MSKRQITYYTETYLVGGAERYLIDLISGCDPDRFEVNVLHNPNADFARLLDQSVVKPIMHRTVPIIASPGARLGYQSPTSLDQRLGFWWPISAPARALLRYTFFTINLRRVAHVLQHTPTDVLHINNGGYPGGNSCRAIAIAAQRLNIPVRLMTIHNLPYAVSSFARLEHRIDQQVSQALHGILTDSEEGREALIAVRGFEPAQVHKMYLGTQPAPVVAPADLDRLRHQIGLPPDALVVGSVAAFEPRKGQAVLVQAMQEVIKQRSNTQCVLVGDGPTRAALEAQAGESGLQDHFHFTGWRADFRAILQLLDVFAMPSVELESLPYVISEAMAAAKPVVGTHVGGVPEQVADGVTGYIVKPGQAAPLARALSDLLGQPERARAMGAAGQQRWAELFSFQRMITNIEHLYQP